MKNQITVYGIHEITGERLRIIDIGIGQSRSSVKTLYGDHNSIDFISFVNEKNEEINIYALFSPYHKDGLFMNEVFVEDIKDLIEH